MSSITNNKQEKTLPDIESVSKIIEETARDEIVSRFEHLHQNQIRKKESGEVVTDADLQSEKKLTKDLTNLVPNSSVLGEEGYYADNSILDLLTDKQPVWIVDPLDGTRNFSEGIRCFCVIVAYYTNNTISMGWIYDPLNQNMLVGIKGQGAWENGIRLSTDNIKLAISDMDASIGKKRREYLLEKHTQANYPKSIQRYRCLGMEYADIARGNIHFAEYHKLKPWDHAAGVLIIEEAGGLAAYSESGEKYSPAWTNSINQSLIVSNKISDWERVRAYLKS